MAPANRFVNPGFFMQKEKAENRNKNHSSSVTVLHSVHLGPFIKPKSLRTHQQ